MKKEEIALSIVKKLQEAGHIAYYAGGYVRDLLLHIPSDDIDIATDAKPEEVEALFPKTLPIGIAFGIILVIENKVSFEIATFRKEEGYEDGRHPNSISLATPVEDAKRRDFTINGMFFDPITHTILDYVDGEKDLKKKILRAIGDPDLRFKEDRLRMLRAVRFASKFSLTIEEKTKEAIYRHAKDLFPSVAIERVYQELTKMAENSFEESIKMLYELTLLPIIFPSLAKLSKEEFETRVSLLKTLPKTALLLKILELLSCSKKEEIENLIVYLKLSKKDLNYALFYLDAKKFLHKEKKSLFEWVQFLSHPLFKEQVSAYITHIENPKILLLEIEKKEEELDFFIQKKKANEPLLTAKDLQNAGISSGKTLGDLLKEGEKIAINENLRSSEKIIERLKKSSTWPNY